MKKLGAFLINDGNGNKTPVTEPIAYTAAQLDGNNPFLWIDDADSFPVDGNGDSLYETVCSVAAPDFKKAFEYGENATSGYKANRDNIKDIANAIGWVNLSTENQVAAAKNNIGTGAQILAAIPNDEERDKVSYDYQQKTKGYATGERPERTLRTLALVWSRLKHIEINVPNVPYPVGAPELILSLIAISNPTPVPGETNGILLDLYLGEGIQGFILGDLTLGLGDFIKETPNTRYENAGLVHHPLLANLQPSGFSNMADFADKVWDVWQNGNY